MQDPSRKRTFSGCNSDLINFLIEENGQDRVIRIAKFPTQRNETSEFVAILSTGSTEVEVYYRNADGQFVRVILDITDPPHQELFKVLVLNAKKKLVTGVTLISCYKDNDFSCSESLETKDFQMGDNGNDPCLGIDGTLPEDFDVDKFVVDFAKELEKSDAEDEETADDNNDMEESTSSSEEEENGGESEDETQSGGNKKARSRKHKKKKRNFFMKYIHWLLLGGVILILLFCCFFYK